MRLTMKQLEAMAKQNDSGARKAFGIIQQVKEENPKNPLFRIWEILHGKGAKYREFNRPYSFGSSICENMLREICISEYAFAIPPDHLIIDLANWFPQIVEVGAGLGYWAHLLKQAGCQIEAFDIKDYKNHYWKPNFKRWFEIQHYKQLFNRGWKENDTLFLCWPPYDSSMAHRWISYFTLHSQNEHIILIGEGSGGCTGWSELLDEGGVWKKEKIIEIPQWWGIHDYLTIFKRIK